ncbi:unnamed protein product, partial [Phaeothamnion confervicola]
QVVVWDVRAKALPVQRTPLSATGHTHPIYSIALQGSAASHTLVTASTDGMVARWNLGQLAQPMEVLHFRQPPPDGKAPDDKRCVLGSESGDIYLAPTHARSTGSLQEFRGHYGMVTSVDINPSKAKELQELVLSSSVDWTTRLWHLKRGGAQPLLTFSHGTYDYVCDAKWSPKHPALFVTANISGDLALWNLNHSTEDPLAPPAAAAAGPAAALTKVAWAHDGRRLAVGDDGGVVRIYSIAEHVAIPQRPDEEARLEAMLRGKGVLR